MSEVLQTILETIWLLLPAGVANTAPVIAAKFNWAPQLNRPIQERLLGSNKTWRGLGFGILFGSIAGILLKQGVVYGAAVGFGALAGDAIKSFFKRRFKIPPGQPWRPWDQVDLAIGGIFAAAFFVPLTIAHIITGIIVTFLISYSVSAIGVALKLKSSV